jgi:hypothetical protein
LLTAAQADPLEAMAGEDVVASVHRQDVLADQAANQSVEPDALARKELSEAGVEELLAKMLKAAKACLRRQDFEPAIGRL